MFRAALAVLIVAPLRLASPQRDSSVQFLRTPIVVSDSVARRECTKIPRRELYLDPPVSHHCRIVSYDTLSAANGRRWSYAVQRHTSVYNFADSGPAAKLDTIVEIETVLLRERDPRSLVAVLHAREEEWLIRSITPVIAIRSATEGLLSMEFCLNGTGGCRQDYWRYDAKGWYRLDTPVEAIRERVLRAFPGDSSHRLREPHIDVRTLRGTAPISADGDANCCSSYEAEFRLALDRGTSRFRIVEFRVISTNR
jgi:hypothetical protein